MALVASGDSSGVHAIANAKADANDLRCFGSSGTSHSGHTRDNNGDGIV
jgi:hypothetical protein